MSGDRLYSVSGSISRRIAGGSASCPVSCASCIASWYVNVPVTPYRPAIDRRLIVDIMEEDEDSKIFKARPMAMQSGFVASKVVLYQSVVEHGLLVWEN